MQARYCPRIKSALDIVMGFMFSSDPGSLQVTIFLWLKSGTLHPGGRVKGEGDPYIT